MKHIYEGKDNNLDSALDNRNDLDLGISVNNVMLLGGRFQKVQFTGGLFTLDMRVFEKDKLLSNAIPTDIAKVWNVLGAPMIPILSFGSTMGTNMRALLQVDVLPLPSFKTGIIYNF